MEIIKKITISYWYNEMTSHPKEKINILQEELKGIIDTSLMYNDEEVGRFISLPRIQGISKSKDYSFLLSLINASLTINVHDMDIDDIILLVNNYSQSLYDALKNSYGVTILYTSIKLELSEDIKHAADVLAKRFDFEKGLDDFAIRKGFAKDDYYINYLLNSGKEFNYNINRKETYLEQDIFDNTLITSLKNANESKEFIAKLIEINDRLAFNRKLDYESSKDSIRGMIIELKKILNTKEYDKK